MKERPILFSGPMVRALLAGTKTQTRRAAKVESTLGIDSILAPRRAGGHAATYLLPDQAAEAAVCCPYGQPGDRLWVRETWAYGIHAMAAERDEDGPFVYAADGTTQGRLCDRWTPSIHMPRAASRITLDIKAVRVERLRDVSDDDLAAEGIQELIDGGVDHDGTPRDTYRALWEQLNGYGSWGANPWVWVVEFERAQAQQKGPHGE